MQHGLSVEDIPVGTEPTPDYVVRGAEGRVFIAEVKEVTPDRQEAEQWRRILAGEIGMFETTPGDRLRSLIKKANRQLECFVESTRPGVLVVYNFHIFLGHHTEDYSVLTAMRGLDEVPIQVPRDPSESPKFLPVRSGQERAMRRDKNTKVAAVAIVRGNADGWVFHVYHNRFADHPLPRLSFGLEAMVHYRIRGDERGWEEMELELS